MSNLIPKYIQNEIWDSIPDEYKDYIISYYKNIDNDRYKSTTDEGRIFAIEDIFGFFNIQDRIHNDN